MLLHVAWMLFTVLKLAGLVIALGGVAIFGWYFVRANARTAKDDNQDGVPVAWGGPKAKWGVKVLGLGLLLQALAFVLAGLLPGRM